MWTRNRARCARTRRNAGEKATRDFKRPAATPSRNWRRETRSSRAGANTKIRRVLCLESGADDELAMWRLCPNCSHAEPASSTENLASCPSCGSMQWADSGQKRPMLRIDSSPLSDETYSESLIEDTSDSRPKTQVPEEYDGGHRSGGHPIGMAVQGTTNFGFDTRRRAQSVKSTSDWFLIREPRWKSPVARRSAMVSTCA